MIRLQLSHVDVRNTIVAIEETRKEIAKRVSKDGLTNIDYMADQMLRETLRNIRAQVPSNFQWPA